MFLRLKKTVLLSILCVLMGMGRGDALHPDILRTPPPVRLFEKKAGVFASVPVTNYCSDILYAIANGDTDTVCHSLVKFFNKIPYNMQNLSKKRRKRGETASMYKAVCHMLCQVLEEAAKTGKQGSHVSAIHVLTKEDQPDVMYMPFISGKHACVFQFSICDEANPSTQSYQRYDYLYKGASLNTVYVTIAFDKWRFAGVKIRQKNDGTPVKHVKFIHIGEPILLDSKYPFKADNVYADAIQCLVPEQENNELLGRLLKDNIAQLSEFSWAPTCEKYFQNIFIALLRFIGVGFVEPEVTTFNGRIDIILYSNSGKVIIFELKYKKDAEQASTQILERDYASITDAETIGVGVNLTGDNGIEIETRRIEKKATYVGIPTTISKPWKSHGPNVKKIDR